MSWKLIIKIPKICLISFLLTFLTPELIHRQSLLAETFEVNNNPCDSLPQSQQFTVQYQSNHPQLIEAQRLNQEIQQLYNQGLYAQAIPLAERILSIYQETLGDNSLEVAAILNRLANLNYQVNNIDKSETFLKQALKIREFILGKDHPMVAQILNSMAENYRLQKKYSESEFLYLRALSIYENTCGENHILFIGTLSNLSVLYMNKRQYEQAESVCKRAMRIYNNLDQDNNLVDPVFLSSTKNIILNNLATVYLFKKDYSQANQTLEQIIKNYEQENRNEHPQLAIILNNLAFLQLVQGNLELALNSLNRGMDIEERHLILTLPIGSEKSKQAYMKSLEDTTYRAISLHLQNAPNRQEAANLSLKTILRRKGRVLDFMADSLGLLRQNLTVEQQNLLDQLQERRRQIAMLKFNPVQPLDTTRIKVLETEEKQLEARLLRESAEFRAEAQQLEIQDIQQLIPANTALVEFVSYKPFDISADPDQRWGDFRYAAYILTAHGQVRWVDLGEAKPILLPIQSFRYALSRESREQSQIDFVRNTARALDEKIMQPIRQQLSENIQHILIAPDDWLNLIPFGALVDEKGQYLVENYTLTYLTSGRDLLRLQSDTAPQQPPVIIANPNYQNRGEPSSRNSSTQTSNRNLLSREMISISDPLTPLPGTQEEAQTISGLLPEAIVITQSQATENAVKAVISPQILHLATHGFFLPPEPDDLSENPLLRSGLALAGYDQRNSGGEDGVLTALEVASLNLQGTQLVVLSACQTGLGEIYSGEGVYGLRRAFVIAGARSQLSSLWNVDDRATKELMEKYYQRLVTGEGMSEAWRQTQLEMLQSQQYQHPYYWAAFIPSGDWTAISLSKLTTSQF